MMMNHAPPAVGDNAGAGGDMMYYINYFFVSILLYLIYLIIYCYFMVCSMF